MKVSDLPEVPKAHFATCVSVLDQLETDAGRAALIAGLFGYFLANVPEQTVQRWAEAITHLAHEAAAVARNAEGAADDV